MKKINAYEEIELDKFMETHPLEPACIPEALEERIKDQISHAPVKKRHTLMFTAACIAAMLLLSSSVLMLTPRFAVYARNMPVFNVVIKWLYGDSGLREAAAHGYADFKQIEMEKDGFILQIRDFALDEERLVVTAALGGPKVADAFGVASIYVDLSFPELVECTDSSGTVSLTGSKYKNDAWMDL